MSLSAVILTYNEEQHIERCIQSVSSIVDDIFVIDSFSSDNTIKIAERNGAKVFQNKWVNYATQFNWALDNCSIKSEWVWRIDADEYADDQLIKDLSHTLQEIPKGISGIYVNRGIVFQGHKLKFGTWAPRPNLKIFRYGDGRCENRWMDEHIQLNQGETISVVGTQWDDNLNNLTWWTEKHNSYATREMVDMYCLKYGLGPNNGVEPKLFGTSEQRLRWLKLRYAGIPLFVRPFINFGYRYIIRLGFLDGKQGFLWHILQGFWYRMLVDAKIWEMNRKFDHKDEDIINYLKERYSL